jgi:hypothetical protein
MVGEEMLQKVQGHQMTDECHSAVKNCTGHMCENLRPKAKVG